MDTYFTLCTFLQSKYMFIAHIHTHNKMYHIFTYLFISELDTYIQENQLEYYNQYNATENIQECENIML